MFNLVQHLKNIKKIYSLNFKIIFIIKYITGLFKKKIINKINKLKIEEFRRIEKEGQYQFNWTTSNSHNFLIIKQVLDKARIDTIKKWWGGGVNSLENLRILEIGSFEGYSANIFNKLFPNQEIYCVDPWLPYFEIPNVNFNTVESNFDKNTQNINIKKFKMFSSNFFNNNKENFEIIYIDGSHKADNVFYDAMESFKILKKGGILLFDDFLGSSEFDNNQVIDGVALFLNKINDNSLKLISINSQICFLKL
jgi:hypothetical protein